MANLIVIIEASTVPSLSMEPFHLPNQAECWQDNLTCFVLPKLIPRKVKWSIRNVCSIENYS